MSVIVIQFAKSKPPNSKMRNYLGLIVATLSISFAFGLECKMAVSEEECSRLHGRYQELIQEYERVADRMHINPSAYQVLHSELARIATFIGQPIPGSTEEETQEYATMYSATHLMGEDKSDYSQTYTKIPEPLNVDYSDKAEETEATGLSEKVKQVSTPVMKGNRYGSSKSVQNEDHKAKKCHDFVPKEKCDELLSQYAILKELYSNETTKRMLNMDAYNDLHRDLTEAGLSVKAKNSESSDVDTVCHISIGREQCETLMKKYKLMKEMYSDADLKKMLNPDAYNELHREMEEAGINIEGSNKEGAYNEMSCDSSVPKEECDALLKKYALMKEMYNDADLKDMLNPDAYNELHHEMEEAGLKTDGKEKKDAHKDMKCASSVPKEECDALLKKYELMNKMYNDADLKDMLNPDAYNELQREMEEAGLKTDGKKKEAAYNEMSCESSVPKKECDALLKKYELMKEMYNDADLKKMLNPDSYNELHQEMEEAGLKTHGETKKAHHNEMSCDSSVPKEECDALLKKYKLMKEMYNDADLKNLLNPDAYNELHREMEDVGLKTDGKEKEGAYNEMNCDSSVPKKQCDALLKKYKLMKEMYNNDDLKKMLNHDAYNELHRDMEEAGLKTDGQKKEDHHNEMSCDSSVPKEECDALLKKYGLMKEMYNDADLKKMLNPDAYNELHREMEEAGIKLSEVTKKDTYKTMSCDSSVPKEECDALLKKYELMKEMYNDADLKKMLNPDAYNELHQEMQEAGINIEGKTKDAYSTKRCHKSVSKETCDALLKKYKLMTEMYSDADLKGMLNPDAYSELHQEMEQAGIKVDRTMKGGNQQNYPLIRQCSRDGLYRYDDYSFIFCSEGLGFVQMCPKGSKNGQEEIIDLGYGRQMFCNTGIQYLSRDTTEKVDS